MVPDDYTARMAFSLVPPSLLPPLHTMWWCARCKIPPPSPPIFPTLHLLFYSSILSRLVF